VPVPSHGPLARVFSKSHIVKIKIRVLNPASAAVAYVSIKNAARYVARGRARWDGDRAIRFIEDSHQHESATRAAALQTKIGYDGVGRISMREVHRIPVVMPARLIYLRTRAQA